MCVFVYAILAHSDISVITKNYDIFHNFVKVRKKKKGLIKKKIKNRYKKVYKYNNKR